MNNSATQQSVLVTGGAGYIGSHMVRQLLAANFQVTVFDNLQRGNRDAIPTEAEFIKGDLTDTESIASAFGAHAFDTVLHFAALAYVGESVNQPDLYYRNNVVGTLNLVDAMRKHSVNKLVFSSTCATYGTPLNLPITEETPQAPINPYGQSKLMVEHLLKDYAVAFGFRSIALRYFNASGSASDASLGERHEPETHLIPLILWEALRVKNGGNPKNTDLRVFGSDLPTPDGTCVRDYIHVEDLCSAHIAALHRMTNTPNEGAEQFNLGVNQGFSVLEVIKACSEVTGIEIQYQLVDRRAGDPPELVADASKAMRELQWTPNYPNVRAAIEHAWQWYLKNPPPVLLKS